jgi:site-specific DNA recombinase
MRAAIYARVWTTRQAQAQTIEQQLDRLQAAVAERGWTLDEQHVDRDDGYSGAGLSRPGLDRLRDQAALAELDLVLVTAPDRLARNYVHQVLLIDELDRHGCQVEFLDRPMSHDPHDQLLLGDPRGGRRIRAHADRRADAPRAAGQATGRHLAALDHAAVRLPAGPRTPS